jgi:hypothetical protein
MQCFLSLFEQLLFEEFSPMGHREDLVIAKGSHTAPSGSHDTLGRNEPLCEEGSWVVIRQDAGREP